jgi:micrococcal nuclease
VAAQGVKLSPNQRRLRYAGRRVLLVLILAGVAAGLILADHFGVFGRKPLPDIEKYDGRTFRVVHVVDGDTLDVDAPDGRHHRTRIRLWGVDTPETVKPNTPVQHFGQEAGAFAKSLTLDQVVRLELDRHRGTRDKYGRLLAYVWLPDGRMLNRVLVEEGYGYADPRFDHRYKSEFTRLQHQAKDAGRGLWKDVKPQDLPYYMKDKISLTNPSGNRGS